MDKQFARVIRKTDKNKPITVVLNKIANEKPKKDKKKDSEEQK